MRLFVAIYPSTEAVADLLNQVRKLAVAAPRDPGRSLRLVPPERWHITLAFLGEVADDRVPAAPAAVTAAVHRWRGREVRPERPRLWLGGGGRYGRGRSTALWTGVRGDVPALADLAVDLRRELRAAKLPFDWKPFRPHLTLARPGDRLPHAEVQTDLAELNRYEGPKWTVRAVDLMRSHQGPQPRYERLATAALTP